MTKRVEDALHPFTQQQLALYGTISDRALEYGVTADELREAITLRLTIARDSVVPASQARSKAPSERKSPVTQCPECGSAVVISPVNVSKCTNVGGDWRTSLLCSNAGCCFTELSVKTIADWSNDNAIR